MAKHKYPDLFLGGTPIRGLNLFAIQILVNPVADVLGGQLLLLTPEPLRLCLILGRSGE